MNLGHPQALKRSHGRTFCNNLSPLKQQVKRTGSKYKVGKGSARLKKAIENFQQFREEMEYNQGYRTRKRIKYIKKIIHSVVVSNILIRLPTVHKTFGVQNSTQSSKCPYASGGEKRHKNKYFKRRNQKRIKCYRHSKGRDPF